MIGIGNVIQIDIKSLLHKQGKRLKYCKIDYDYTPSQGNLYFLKDDKGNFIGVNKRDVIVTQIYGDRVISKHKLRDGDGFISIKFSLTLDEMESAIQTFYKTTNIPDLYRGEIKHTEKTKSMDKIFYRVEQWSDGKIIHIFGEIYQFGNGEEKDYRLVQFTGAYLEIEDIQGSGGKFIEYIYNDSEKVYEKDITEAEAQKCCKTYFNGTSGTEHDVYKCDEDTPCGDYWCEI